ncbi:MAG: hypothetical protein ACI4EF_01510, partial [Coprococcus sp.]
AICCTTNVQSIGGTILIASIAAIVAYLSTKFVDEKLHIDDACGAGSLHFVSGIIGVLAPGFLGASAGIKQFGIQLLAEVCVFTFIVVVLGTICLILKSTIGLRVDDKDQILGMDISEHHTYAYDYLESNYEAFEEQEAKVSKGA